MEELGFERGGGFAVGLGHGGRVAEGHAGGSAEDAADGEFAVGVGEEDFADS